MSQKEKLLKQFFSTMFRVRRIVDQSFTASGEIATFLQVQALEYIHQHPKSTVGELAQELYMSSPAIAQFTDRLINASLITRETDKDDRRVVRLSLTKTGRQEMQTVPMVIQKKMSETFSQIPEQDIKELIRIFTNVLKNLDDQKK